MAVWSAERLAANVKKQMRLPMLPRARSTPGSRHWMMQPEAGNAAAQPSLGNATPRTWAASAPSCTRTEPVVSYRQSNAAVQRNRHTSRHRHRSNAMLPLAAEPQSSPSVQRTETPQHSARYNQQSDLSSRQRTPHAKPEMQCLPRAPAGRSVSEPRTAKLELPPNEPRALPPCPSAVRAPCTAEKFTVDQTDKGTCDDFKKIRRDISAGPKQLVRKLSLQSEAAMEQLGTLDATLRSLEKRVEDLKAFALGSKSLAPEAVGRMRTSLAHLEAEANKLETKGVDSIYTSQLLSGAVAAKEAKKAQLQRLEKLFGLIEELFRFLTASKPGE